MDLEDGCYKLGATVVHTSESDGEEVQEFTGDSESPGAPEAVSVKQRRQPAKRANEAASVTQQEVAWTNDRHVSYLNSMEQAFVRKLHSRSYGQQHQQHPSREQQQSASSSVSCKVDAETPTFTSENSFRRMPLLETLPRSEEAKDLLDDLLVLHSKS